MHIYYSMFYVLLHARYPLVDLAVNSTPIELYKPAFYQGTLESGVIYIVNDTHTFTMPEKAGDYVVVFLDTDAIGLRFPDGFRALLMGNCHDPVTAYQAMYELFHQFEMWNLSLIECNLPAIPVSQMLKLFYDFLPQRIVFSDDNYRHIYEYPAYNTPPEPHSIVYATSSSPSPTNPEFASYEQFSISYHAEQLYAIEDCPNISVKCCKEIPNVIVSCRIFDGSKLIGTLVIRYEENTVNNLMLVDGYCRIMDILGSNFSKKLSFSMKGSLGPGNNPLHEAFKNLLESRETSTARAVLSFLPELGWSQEDRYLVVNAVMDSQSAFAEASGYLCGLFETTWKNCVAVREVNTIVLLFNVSCCDSVSEEKIIQTISQIRKDHPSVVSGIAFSNYFQDILLFSEYYKQSVFLLKHRNLWSRKDWVFFFREHSMDYLTEHLNHSFSVEYLCHPGVWKLYQYDRSHHTELIPTLYFFMKHHTNMSTAAAAISKHRTTFIKRMEKIEEIAQFNFESVDEQLHILLSLKLLLGSFDSV